MRILGIDPGLSGALAIYDVEAVSLIIHDMPVFAVKSGKKTRNEMNAAAFATLVSTWPISHCFIEKVGAMPGQGVVSMFRFGECFGIAQGVVAALQIPITYVQPQRWKGRMGLGSDSSKGGARKLATNLFPAYAGTFARVKDDGRAEAALIALYGARELSH